MRWRSRRSATGEGTTGTTGEPSPEMTGDQPAAADLDTPDPRDSRAGLEPIPEFDPQPGLDSRHDPEPFDDQAGEIGLEPPSAELDEPAPTAAAPPADLPPQIVPEPARAREQPGVMIPARSHRSAIETFFVRLIATGGIVGISVAVAAIMGSHHSHQWLIGLVVSVVSVILAAILWSSQRV